MHTFFILLLSILSFNLLTAQHIYVEGNQFKLNGKIVYMNGCNTPWDKWNDFGGNYDSNFWEAEFKRLNQNGINSVRVWISCNGDVQPNISSDGTVTGVSSLFWTHVDDLVARAEKYKIYLMPTMMSFDHTKNTYIKFESWRKMLNDSSKVRSYIDNYLIPFVNRYKNNPYVFCIDLCNEPEWMHENVECGQLSWEVLQRYTAMCAAAIHNTGSKVLVSVGSASVKWNSPSLAAGAGNMWSDVNLKKQYNDPKAKLDIWQIHYYAWMLQYFHSPFTKSTQYYYLQDRPTVIGEMPAREIDLPSMTFTQAFNAAFSLGYRGHYPWTSNGTDEYGNLTNFAAAALQFSIDYATISDVNTMDTIISSLYPNPVKSRLFIKGYQRLDAVSIFSVDGRRMMHVEKPTDSLNVEELTPGNYVLETHVKGKTVQMKFVKE